MTLFAPPVTAAGDCHTTAPPTPDWIMERWPISERQRRSPYLRDHCLAERLQITTSPPAAPVDATLTTSDLLRRRHPAAAVDAERQVRSATAGPAQRLSLGSGHREMALPGAGLSGVGCTRKISWGGGGNQETLQPVRACQPSDPCHEGHGREV